MPLVRVTKVLSTLLQRLRMRRSVRLSPRCTVGLRALLLLMTLTMVLLVTINFAASRTPNEGYGSRMRKQLDRSSIRVGNRRAHLSAELVNTCRGAVVRISLLFAGVRRIG